MKNKSAFTLIELLVYMAILGFIIVVAGRAFSDATGMRIRSQNMIKSAEEVGRVSNLIKEDISQTGTKAWGQNLAGVYTISYNNNFIYIDPSATTPDLSSFKLYREAVTSAANSDIKYDSLVFRKVAFGNDGAFLGVREIKWEVNEQGELRRWCQTINGNDDDECPENEAQEVLMARNVKKFSFFPSAPGTMPIAANANAIPRDTVFPLELTNPNARIFNLLSRPANAGTNNIRVIESSYETVNNGTIANINSFTQNATFDNPAATDRYNEVYLVPPGETQIEDCMDIPIQKGETYIVEFNMPFLASNFLNPEAGQRDSLSTQFLPGVDHLAVGLRFGDATRITGVSPDVLLYAPQSIEADNKPRYAEFTAKNDIDRAGRRICVALTFSFYSPIASKGKLRFSDFKVYKKQTGTYHFVKESNNYNVNFAKIYATEDDNTATRLSNKKNVKAFELLLEIDMNGEVAGTYSKDSTGMTISVPNNGVTKL